MARTVSIDVKRPRTDDRRVWDVVSVFMDSRPYFSLTS